MVQNYNRKITEHESYHSGALMLECTGEVLQRLLQALLYTPLIELKYGMFSMVFLKSGLWMRISRF